MDGASAAAASIEPAHDLVLVTTAAACTVSAHVAVASCARRRGSCCCCVSLLFTLVFCLVMCGSTVCAFTGNVVAQCWFRGKGRPKKACGRFQPPPLMRDSLSWACQT